MNHKFKYEDLTIYGEGGDEAHTINAEVELKCTDRGSHPSFNPRDGGHDGHPAVWEVRCIWLQHPSMASVLLSEQQFVLIFPDGQDILNNALEDAHSNGKIDDV